MEELKLAQQKVKKQQKIKKNDNVFAELNKEDIDFLDLREELDPLYDLSLDFDDKDK